MQNPTSELGIIALGADIQATLHINDYEIQVWRPQCDSKWVAFVAWYGDQVALAEADGETAADALWSVSAAAGETAPSACVLAELPARLRAFTDALSVAAIAKAEAEDTAAARCVAAVAA